MNTPELTVIIPTHNRAALLDELLSSVARQQWDGSWEVLVVDNASSDDTSRVLERWVSALPVPLRVHRALDGSGPAHARNVGAGQTSAPHLAFVDDDDLLAPGWVAAIGKALRGHQLVGSRHEFERLNPAEVAAADDTGAHGFSRVGTTPVTPGAGFGCHADLWHTVGGMNELLRYGEDIDFSLRASQLGVEPYFVGDARYHVRLRDDTLGAFHRGRQLGRASVDVYVRHGRALGQQPDRPGVLARVWVAYLVRALGLFDRGRRLVYAQQLGRRVGRIEGSVNARVWYL